MKKLVILKISDSFQIKNNNKRTENWFSPWNIFKLSSYLKNDFKYLLEVLDNKL